MKLLSFAVTAIGRTLTVSLVCFVIAGCSTRDNGTADTLAHLPDSELWSSARAPEEKKQPTTPDDNFAQSSPSLTNEESANQEPKRYKIDLPTALRLASAQNYKVAIATEKITEASAQVDQSEALLLPSIAVGTGYYKHEGELQATEGDVFNVNRSSGYTGLGVGPVGSGTPKVPGVAVTTDIAAAFFEPLAARQNARAAKAGARAVTNKVLLDVSIAYYNLVETKAGLAIAEETLENASYLAKLTRDFAETGEGLESDAERAAVEELLRRRELQKAREEFQVRSARLAELLHLDAKIQLNPSDKDIVPIHIVAEDRTLSDLIDTALVNHPEVKQRQAQIDRDYERFRQAKYGPLIPKVGLNFSAGSFSGGSSFQDDSGGRSDYHAMIYWQFNFDDEARTREQRSVYRQARLQRLGTIDRITSEIARTHARVKSLQKQISSSASAVKRASRSLELNRARIYEKQGLPIEVLQAIQSLGTTRRLYLETVIDYNKAQLRLYTALGQPPTQAISGTQKLENSTSD